MNEPIIYFVKHDPWVVFGLLLLAVTAGFVFHLHSKLQTIGDRSYRFFRVPNTILWTAPRAYLQKCHENEWPSWPAYATWVCALSGVCLLIVGLFKL